jgi:serine phosphatase RsbU (regulator of sigma subunit)
MAEGPAPSTAPDSAPKKEPVKAPASQPKMKAVPSSAPKGGGAPEGKSPGPASQPKMKAASPPGPASQSRMKAASPPGPASQPKMKAAPAPPPKPAPAVPTAEFVEPARTRGRAETGETRVRRRADAVPPRKGLGLQLKIMLAMGLTSLLGAAGIAAAVYSRAATAFEEQIDARGERLVDILAVVPADYWMFAIHGFTRENDFADLVRMIEPVDEFTQKPEYTRLRNVLNNPFSKEWQEEIDRLITAVSKNPQWKEKVEGNPELKSRYDRLVRPMAPLSELAPFRALVKEGDLVNVGVFDATRPGDTNPPGILPAGRATLNLPQPRGAERITKADAPIQGADGSRMNIRMFIRNPHPDDPVKLRYLVSLSLHKIEDAKKSLIKMILFPALIAFGASLAIAAILSHRITKPVRLLMGDINQVSSGDFEHQTSARSSDEIGQLAASFNRMTTALRAAQEQELTTRAMEHELGIASEIQTNLVPKSILKVPGYDVGAYYRPSKEVGGDYYDFIEIDENRSGLIVADVSGKGVPGSLVMAMARAFIRMEAERSRNPSTADTLARANKMLARDMRKGMFVTAIYGILDRTNNLIRVSSAGHNPMILWRARTEEIVLVNPKGIALGLDKGPVFDRSISEEIIQLEPGDRVVFYTDGTVEAMNEKREEFGDKRFQDLVRKLAKMGSNEFLNVLVKALDEHQGNAPQHDDMTIVTFRRV